MTPFDLLLVVVAAGFISIFLDRRWPTHRPQNTQPSSDGAGDSAAQDDALLRNLSWGQRQARRKAEKAARQKAKEEAVAARSARRHKSGWFGGRFAAPATEQTQTGPDGQPLAEETTPPAKLSWGERRAARKAEKAARKKAKEEAAAAAREARRRKSGWFGGRGRKPATEQAQTGPDGQPLAEETTPPAKLSWGERRAARKAEKAARKKAKEEAAAAAREARRRKSGWFGGWGRKPATEQTQTGPDGQPLAEETTPPAKLSWVQRRAKRKAEKAARKQAEQEAAEAARAARRRKSRWFGGWGRQAATDQSQAETTDQPPAEEAAPPAKLSWAQRRANRKAEKEAKRAAPPAERADEDPASSLAAAPIPDEEKGGEADLQEERSADPFSTLVAILIALVTLAGAWVGWSIGAVYGEVSDAQSAGISAALNVESTLTNSSVALYKEYRVYTEYTRYQTLADLQAEVGPGESAAGLPARKSNDADLAAVQLPFFLTRYLTRDGVYDKPRQLGEAWAEAAQRVDLEPAPHFAAADVWQRKTELLVAIFIVLSFSLLLLTLAEALAPQRRLLRYSAAGLGALLLIVSVVVKLWIERG